MLTLLIVLLIFSLVGGGFFYGNYGPAGFSPMGIIIAIVLVLWLTGRLHL